MSTKIYNGYKMKALSPKALLTFVNEFKEIITESYKERYFKLVADKISKMVDYLSMADADKDFTKIDDLLLSYHLDYVFSPRYMMQNRQAIVEGKEIPDLKKVRGRFLKEKFPTVKTIICDIVDNKLKEVEVNHTIMNSEYDMEAAMVMFPITSKYTIFLTYSDEFTRLLNKMLGNVKSDNPQDKYVEFIQKYEIEEYHYQNQVDRPSSISAREWSMRKRNWNNALKSGVPSADGITIELASADSLRMNFVFAWPENIMPYTVSKTDRVHRYAYENMFDAYCLKHKERHNIEKLSFSDVLEADRELKELVKNSESKEYKDIKAKQERLENIIPEINAEVLKKTITDLVPNYVKKMEE